MPSGRVEIGYEFVDNGTRNRGQMALSLTAPPVAGYSFDRAADLTDARERARLSRGALKAFAKIAEKWSLSEEQARGLLGGIASSTFHAWKSRPEKVRLDQDTLTRISLVLGIYKGLNIYFNRPWADRWITLGNRGPMFNGQAPIEFMRQHGQPGMIQVRRLLDSWRGGQ